MGHYPNRRSRSLLSTLLVACLCGFVACGPQTPDDVMDSARDEIAAGEPRAAEIRLKNLLFDDPDNGEARRLLGEVLLAVGDPAGGEQSLRRAIELGVPLHDVRMPLLGALIAQGKFTETLALIADSKNVPAEEQVAMLLIAGMAHRGLESPAQADAVYREALEIEPTSPEVRSALAGFLLEAGRSIEAQQLVTAVLEDEPDYPPALFVKGTIEHEAGRDEAAEASFMTILDSDDSDQRTRLAARARLVETHLALGKISEAVAGVDRAIETSPRDPVLQYLKARVEFEQQDLDAAALRLQGLVADFPGYEPPYKLLGNIKLMQGRVQQAATYLRTAVKNDPSDHSARLLLAEAYINDGDLESAKSLFEDIDSLGASDGLFLASAGWLSLDKGETVAASDYFDRSEDSSPASAEELVGVSSIYLAAGEFERAIRVLRDTSLDDTNGIEVRDYLLALVQLRLGDLPAARDAASRLVNARPDSAWSLNLLGTIDLLSKDLVSARRTYMRVLDVAPNDVPALLNLARVAVASNDNDQAGRLLRQVLEIHPGDPTASIGLAQLAARRGDLDEALSWLAKGQESSVLLQLRAEVFTTQERFREATTAFARAFELRPSSTLALKTYAVATRARLPEPESVVRKWVANNPHDVQGNFVLGLLAQADGADDAAIGHYETILAVQPTNTGALNNLAGLYSQRGDERAIEVATRAYILQPDDPAIADTLGWVHVMNKNPDAAIPLLEQAAAGLPQSPEVRYHLSIALAEGTFDSERGLRELRELLESGVAFPSRADAESYLARQADR